MESIMIDIKIHQEGLLFENISFESLPTILEAYSKVNDFDYATGFTFDKSPADLLLNYKELIEDKNSFYSLIRQDSSSLVGFVKGKLLKDKGLLWINSFGIIPWHRRKKYGSKIVTMLITYLKQNYEIKDVYLSVKAGNTVAIKFWQKNDFKIYKEIKKDTTNIPPSVIIMKKYV